MQISAVGRRGGVLISNKGREFTWLVILFSGGNSIFPSIAGDVMYQVLTKSPIGNQTSSIGEKAQESPCTLRRATRY